LTIKDRYLPFLVMGGIALILNTIPMHGLSPILIMLFGIILGILLITLFAPEDFNFLLHVYLIGFILRIFLSFLFYIASFAVKNQYNDGFLFINDGWAYSHQGWRIHQFAERGIKITMENFLYNPNVETLSGNITVYDYFAGFIYSFTDYSPLSLFFISSIAGSIAALFIYFIARKLFTKDVARISSIFAFFWPSFILWSTQNIKEPMVSMLMCILIWSIIYMYRYLSPGFLILSIISIWALFKIGAPYLVIALCMIFLVIFFLVLNHLFKNKFITILVLGTLFMVSFMLLKDRIFELILAQTRYNLAEYNSIFEFLSYHRSVRAYGNLQFFKNLDISSFSRATSFAPLGIIYAIFAPFPWQLGSIMQIMAIPETIAFYILVPFTLKGIIFCYKKRFNQSILLLSIIFSLLIFLGLVEGNSGTLFRHRSIAFCLLFIFTAIGISLKKKRLALKF